MGDRIADITIFTLEVFAKSIKGKEANFETDQIEALFFSVSNDKAKYMDSDNTLKNGKVHLCTCDLRARNCSIGVV